MVAAIATITAVAPFKYDTVIVVARHAASHRPGSLPDIDI